MGKGAGAVLFAGAMVAGYAAWRALRDKEQQPQFVVYPAGYDPNAGGVDAAAWLDGGGSSGGGVKSAILGWGLDTLFGALGGSGGGSIFGGGGAGGGHPASGSGGSSGGGRPAGGSTGAGGGYTYDTPPTGGSGLSALLNVIGGAEAPAGYNQVYGGIKGADRPPKALTSMTVNEVLAWQDSIDSRYNSEAAGRYQIMEDTLRDQVRQGVVGGNELFNENTQDRLAENLMKRRGLDDYRAGRISANTFANNLSKEWAGLPVATGSKAGKSYYDKYNGNSARTSVEAVLDAIGGII